MKKIILSCVVICMSVLSTTAQTFVNFGTTFGVPEGTVALNNPIAKGGDGVALVGDYRSHVEEGHAAGLTYAKKVAYYKIGGKSIKTETAVNMVKYPSGVQKNFQVIPSKMPVNRSIMLKAATDGKLQVLYSSKKGKGRLFAGVLRNGKWEYLGETTWDQGNTAGTENNPYEPLALDYAIKANDVVMLFAGSPVDIAGVYFSGNLDKDFKGDNPRNFVDKKGSKKSKK